MKTDDPKSKFKITKQLESTLNINFAFQHEYAKYFTSVKGEKLEDIQKAFSTFLNNCNYYPEIERVNRTSKTETMCEHCGAELGSTDAFLKHHCLNTCPMCGLLRVVDDGIAADQSVTIKWEKVNPVTAEKSLEYYIPNSDGSIDGYKVKQKCNIRWSEGSVESHKHRCYFSSRKLRGHLLEHYEELFLKCKKCNEIIPYWRSHDHYVCNHLSFRTGKANNATIELASLKGNSPYKGEITELFDHFKLPFTVTEVPLPKKFKDSIHGGSKPVVNSIIYAAFRLWKYVFVPGFNPNEMFKYGYPKSIKTWVSQKDPQWLVWLKAITRQMGSEEKARGYLQSITRARRVDKETMILAYCFNKCFEEDYDVTLDFACIPGPIAKYLLTGNTSGQSGKLFYDHKEFGDYVIKSGPEMNVDVHLGDNTRTYHDFYSVEFASKLAKQDCFVVGDPDNEGQGYFIFGPKDMKLDDVSDEYEEIPPLIGGLKTALEVDKLPEKVVYVDDITHTTYEGVGTWNTHCWYAALLDQMKYHRWVTINGIERQFDENRLYGHVHNALYRTFDNHRETYWFGNNKQNHQTDTVDNHPIVQDNANQHVEAVTPDLPDKLDLPSYVVLLKSLAQIYNRITFTLYVDVVNETTVGDNKCIQNYASKYTFNPGREQRVSILSLLDGRFLVHGIPAKGHAYSLIPKSSEDNQVEDFMLLSAEDMDDLLAHFPIKVHRPWRYDKEIAGQHVKGSLPIGGWRVLGHDPYNMQLRSYEIPHIKRFRRGLACGLNYISLPSAVITDMHWDIYDYHPKYLVCTTRLFPQNMIEDPDGFLTQGIVDAKYIKALLNLDTVDVDYINVEADYRPYYYKHKDSSVMPLSCTASLADWVTRVFNSWGSTDFRLTPRLNTHFVPLVVSGTVVDAYNRYRLADRPQQAFYRNIIGPLLKEYNDINTLCPSPALTLQSLIYIYTRPDGKTLKLKTSVCGIVPSITIPPFMKCIAQLGITPVKLSDYGQHNKLSEFEVIYPPPSTILGKGMWIYYNNSDQSVIDAAVKCRVILGRPTQVVDQEFVYMSFRKFYEWIMPLLEDAVYLDFVQLCEMHPRGTFYKSHYIDYWTALKCICKGFVKTESYFFEDTPTGGKTSPPRGIIVPGPEATAFGLCFTHLVEHYLKRSRNFSKGKNFFEVASDLKALWDSFEVPVVIGCDFTQFENGVNLPVLIASMSIYEYLTGMPEEYIESWMHRVIYFGRSWLLVYIAKRISGEYTTSLGNMLIVGAILYMVVLMCPYHVDFYSAGDDCLIFCDKEHLETTKATILTVVRLFGMLIKVEDVYEDFESIHFCQQYPVLTDKGYCMLNCITRVLDRFAVQSRVIEHTKLAYNRLACIGYYFDYCFGSFKWLRPLIVLLKSLAPWKYPYFNKGFSSSKDWNILQLVANTNYLKPEFTVLNQSKVLDVMGFPEFLCDFYYNYFKNWTPFDYHDVHVDVEYTVEHGRIVFEIGNVQLLNITPKFHDTDLEHDQVVDEDPTLNRVANRMFDKLVKVCRVVCG